jgi:hypothetical protein
MYNNSIASILFKTRIINGIATTNANASWKELSRKVYIIYFKE